jgi:tRNA U34 5-carboxymethylaminomethyl modifying GTPase MnmE/TrmE
LFPDIAGTARDVSEVPVAIEGHPVSLLIQQAYHVNLAQKS